VTFKTLVALCCGIALAILARSTTEWNFDVIAYDGAARIWLNETPSSAHAHVYADLASAAPKDEARRITSLSEYRQAVTDSTEAFMVQLPMYTVKPLYVLLVAAAVKLGANGVAAAHYVSAVAYGCLFLLVLLSLTRIVAFWPALGVSLVLLLTPPFLEAGRLSTPDALSSLVVFAGVYTLVFKSPRMGAALLLLSIAVRPDNVILCLAVASWWWWKDRSANFRSAFFGGTASLAVWLILNRLTGTYSWGLLFTHTYVRRLTDVAGLHSDVTWDTYLGALRQLVAGTNVLYPSVLALFVLVSAIGFVSARVLPKTGDENRTLALQLFVWAALLVHLVAYPMLADRFFVGYYASITVLTISAVVARYSAAELPKMARPSAAA
jgi:hypothetical protein